MSKKKKPSIGAPISQSGKNPRVAEQPKVDGVRFCWRVDVIDWDGPWGWSRASCRDLLEEIVPRLHDLEGMTWGQVVGAGSHFVLCP